MAKHIFDLERWFQDPKGDWDCEYSHLVVDADMGTVAEEPDAGCPLSNRMVMRRHPGATYHDQVLVLHRGGLTTRELDVMCGRVVSALRTKFTFRDEHLASRRVLEASAA